MRTNAFSTFGYESIEKPSDFLFCSSEFWKFIGFYNRKQGFSGCGSFFVFVQESVQLRSPPIGWLARQPGQLASQPLQPPSWLARQSVHQSNYTH